MPAGSAAPIAAAQGAVPAGPASASAAAGAATGGSTVNMSRRDSYILIAIALVGLVAAYWFLALSPKREEAAKLDKDIAAAQQQLDQSKQEKVTSRRRSSSSPACTRASAGMGKAVPPDEDVPSLLVQLNHAAAKANVDFRSVELKLDLAEKQATAGADAAAAARRLRPPARPAARARPRPPGRPAARARLPRPATATARATDRARPAATSGAARPSPLPPTSRRFPSSTSSRAASTTSRS